MLRPCLAIGKSTLLDDVTAVFSVLEKADNLNCVYGGRDFDLQQVVPQVRVFRSFKRFSAAITTAAASREENVDGSADELDGLDEIESAGLPSAITHPLLLQDEPDAHQDAIIKDATYRKGVKEGFFDATVKRAAIVNTHPTDLPTELWMLFAPLRTLVAKPKRVSGIDDGGVFARKTIVPIETTVSDSSAGTDKLATPTRKSIKKSKKLSPDSSGSAGSSGESGTCGTTSADAFRGFLIQGSEAFMKMPPTGTLQNPPFGVEPTPPPLLVMLAAVVIASSGAKPLLQASPRRAPVLLGATTGPLARLRRWLGGIEQVVPEPLRYLFGVDSIIKRLPILACGLELLQRAITVMQSSEWLRKLSYYVEKEVNMKAVQHVKGNVKMGSVLLRKFISEVLREHESLVDDEDLEGQYVSKVRLGDSKVSFGCIATGAIDLSAAMIKSHYEILLGALYPAIPALPEGESEWRTISPRAQGTFGDAGNRATSLRSLNAGPTGSSDAATLVRTATSDLPSALVSHFGNTGMLDRYGLSDVREELQLKNCVRFWARTSSPLLFQKKKSDCDFAADLNVELNQFKTTRPLGSKPSQTDVPAMPNVARAVDELVNSVGKVRMPASVEDEELTGCHEAIQGPLVEHTSRKSQRLGHEQIVTRFLDPFAAFFEKSGKVRRLTYVGYETLQLAIGLKIDSIPCCLGAIWPVEHCKEISTDCGTLADMAEAIACACKLRSHYIEVSRAVNERAIELPTNSQTPTHSGISSARFGGNGRRPARTRSE
mmetsp:Transcript_18258/g.58892  ORF Transcript_18258/g.58892 Transcript_18258/m.58892 type:complete len:772 (+) Transcript_18258:563-2878(+)